MTTVRLGLTAFTSQVPAYAHGLSTVKAVRYVPSECFAELDLVTGNPAWQPIDYLVAEDGDVMLGARPLEQAVIEVEGEPA